MTTRCKTVEYVFPTDQSTLAAATKRSLPALTVYLPESSKVFRSVTLEMGCTDHVTVASSANIFSMEISFAGGPTDAVTVTDTVSSSGESSVYHVSRDVTSYFTTNWTGSSMTITPAITVGTNATNNHWAKLRITYEYDDTSTTHVKTIWYPIETTRTALTTSYQTIGGANAIPAIKGGASILPEANVTVRQVWLELVANQGTSDATDFNLDVKLTTDATEQLALYRVEAALITAGWLHAIWDVSSSALTASQPFEAKNSLSGVAERVPLLCGWIGITYEYEPAGTEVVWNSLMIPAFDEEDQHASSSSAMKALHVKDLWIEEPATITTKPSQVFAFYNDTQEGSAFSLWANGQGARSFTMTATGASMVLGHRIDAGGASGLGISFARGRNRIKINQFGTSITGTGANPSINGFVLVNYTSGKAAGGVGTHNQTRHFALGWYRADATVLEYNDSIPGKTPTIPEANYFLNSVAMQAAWLATADAHQAVRVQAQRTGSEGPDGDGAGWANVYHGAIGSLSENWLRWTTADCTRLFKRWTGDADATRMNLETSRRWMFLNYGSAWVGTFGLLVTYHSITRPIRATVRGTAGDGSGLTVNISRNATGEKILEATTAAGGVYEATWYDDTEALVSDVYEDDYHMGRSAPFFAGE